MAIENTLHRSIGAKEEKLKAEANVEMLAISSNNVFRMIDFTKFTHVRRIALTELTLTTGWIDRLKPLRNLYYICIT